MTMAVLSILSPPPSHVTATSSSPYFFDSPNRAYNYRYASSSSPAVVQGPVKHLCNASHFKSKMYSLGCGGMGIQKRWKQWNVCSALPGVAADVSTIQDLFEFICSGPLLGKMGLNERDISESIDKWLQYGLHLCRLFQLNELFLTIPQKIRIYHYYVPIFFWCEDQIAKHKASYKVEDDVSPLVAVLFEGWMLGFKPVPLETVKAVDPQLEIVNKYMEAYYEAWDKFVKSWIVIKIRDPSCVYDWRLQAEIAMREAGHSGMTDEEVKDFVSRYLPAYKAYLLTLYAEGPDGSVPEHTLVIGSWVSDTSEVPC